MRLRFTALFMFLALIENPMRLRSSALGSTFKTNGPAEKDAPDL
jgi:hypothetical protein